MKLKNLIAPLLTALMLVGCGGNTKSIEEGSADIISSMEPAPTSSEKTSEEPKPDVTPLASGSVGGSLLEIYVAGEELYPEATFNCTFSPSDCEDKHMRAEYDDSIITVTFNANSPTDFTIETKAVTKKSYTVLKLYSLDPMLDCLVYRSLITVTPVVPKAEIENYMFFATESWRTDPGTASIAGNYKMEFISNSPLTMVMSGADEDTNRFKATVELTYKSMRRNYEFMFYVFTTKLLKDESVTERKFDEILVSITGYSIYVYDEDGLMNIFYQAK